MELSCSSGYFGVRVVVLVKWISKKNQGGRRLSHFGAGLDQIEIQRKKIKILRKMGY
jgi:hypothetical protein